MKYQISAQRLRLRIDEAEVERLLREEMVEDTTIFARGLQQTRRLRLTGASAPELQMDAGVLTVVLPRTHFETFAAERPRRDGLNFEWPAAERLPLRVIVEIDVRDSHRRRQTRGDGVRQD